MGRGARPGPTSDKRRRLDERGRDVVGSGGKDAMTLGRVLTMKFLLAIIQPTKFRAVREALVKAQVPRMTAIDAQGYGRQLGRTELYRGNEYKTHLLRKVGLEIVVNDDFFDRTVETLLGAARTGAEGALGDGKIFAIPCVEAISIADGRRGAGAV